MAVTPDRELPFDEDDTAEVLAVLRDLRQRATGWVNLLPQVEPGHEPAPRNPVVGIFSARGEAVPMATWSAPANVGGRANLGIEHGSGPQALAKLARFDLPLEPGWLKIADHTRRGLVVASPKDVDPERELWWLLSATHILSVVPLTSTWLAKIYTP